MTKESYDTYILCYLVNKEDVNESMKKIADEAYVNTDDKQPDDDGNIVANATASFDGTWQRRGYASLNGIVAVICNGKSVDAEVKSVNRFNIGK